MRALICEIRNSGQDKYARVLLPRGFCSIGKHRREIIEGQLRGADVITSRRIKSCLSYNSLLQLAQRHTVQFLCQHNGATSDISPRCVSHGRARKFYLCFFIARPLTHATYSDNMIQRIARF